MTPTACCAGFAIGSGWSCRTAFPRDAASLLDGACLVGFLLFARPFSTTSGLATGLTDCLDGFVDLTGVAAFFAIALADTVERLTAGLTRGFTDGVGVDLVFLTVGLAVTRFFTGLATGLATGFAEALATGFAEALATGLAAVDLRMAAAVLATALATTFTSERVGLAVFFTAVLATGLPFAMFLTGFLIGVRADFGMAILWRKFDARPVADFQIDKEREMVVKRSQQLYQRAANTDSGSRARRRDGRFFCQQFR